jgi:hypothetical protein
MAFYGIDIRILDNAAIFTQMNGNPVRPATRTGLHSLQRIRIIRPARLSQRGYMVNIDTQF